MTTESPSHCFLRLSVAGQSSRTIAIELFTKTCPKTCDNFVRLCSSAVSTSRSKPQPSYRGTEIHRIVDNFMVQGGDFEKFDGSGGYSPLAAGKTFPDESFEIPHDRPGRVSMANRGPNTNGSQFFITLASTPHLDKKHVCFGQVIAGMDVVHDMPKVEREGTRPVAMQKIVVTDCGVGKGEIDDSSDRSSVDRKGSRKDKRKKKSKKSKKKKRKKHRRRDNDSSSDDSSYERRRKKKRKKSRRRDASSSSDDSSGEERYKKRRT